LCAYAPPNTAVGATAFREVPSQRAATSTDSSRVVRLRDAPKNRRFEGQVAEGNGEAARKGPRRRGVDTPNRSKFRVRRRRLRLKV